MIAYSPSAEATRAFLLRNYNDIDIFVEDAACQNMYVRLFGRIFGNRIRLEQVYPLHGRVNVLDKCKSDQAPRPRPRLYLIDGDLDLILGRRVPKLRHLHRLGVYCAENLLICEHAAVMLATESQTCTSVADMRTALDLQHFLDSATQKLLPLFVMYGIVQKLGLGVETVNYSVHRLLDRPNDPASLSTNLIRSRILFLGRLARAHVKLEKYRKTRNAIFKRINKSTLVRRHYISGKTYLLPLLHMRLKSVASFNDTIDHTKVRLAQHSDLSIDRSLKRALSRATKGAGGPPG